MKTTIGPKNCLYPMPVAIVGANVGGKANYLTIAHVGILDFGTVSLSLGKVHYTNPGIKENETFSINIPSSDMVEVVDYCGLVSGQEVDKAELFTTFYGNLETAPMIEECPISMECRLMQTLDRPRHDVFIGEIIQTYCDPKCFTEGVLDYEKVDPLLFIMFDTSYWKLGGRFARAWRIGRNFQKRG